MKKRILSLILALSMVLSVLPLGAFAEGSNQDLVMENGYPVGSSGKGWRYISGTLYLDEGTYNFSSTHPQNTGAGTRPVPAVRCMIEIRSGVEITGGSFGNSVTNYGTISSGTFQTMGGGVINEGTIKNGTFNGDVENRGTIEDGTFEIFVKNEATIENGTFKGTVMNEGTINNGIFEENVENDPDGTISGGAFSSTSEVSNYSGTISGGTFAAGLSWNSGSVTGGVFNGDKKLTEVTGLHSIAVASGAKIEKVNDVSVGASENWDPYVVVTASTKDQEVTITADTEIYSLNGRVLSTNDRVNGDKTTVKFTMPDEDVVLGTGELVMENGYPVGSDDGTADCKGNGWKYTKGDTSNPTGKLTLKKSGKYDFSYTYPQNTSKGAGAEPVACAVETQWDVEITGGTFEGEVINNHLGEISGGTFHEKVSNYNGMISGGTFKSSVTSTDNGRIYGGVFNSKTTQKPATDAYSITLDAAYPNAKITEVNGVSADWAPYVVVTENATTNEVIITADTEIFSLNGKPIGDGNCKSSYDGSDYKTVKFTMPGEPVVLNGAITSTDLVMENGWPKDSDGGKNPCKGDGWEYIKNDPTNGDMLLLTDGLFDFSTIGDGSAVECKVFVGKPTAITGGEFNGKVINNSGILGGTFHGEVDNRAPGRIVNGTFNGAVENNGIIENGTFKNMCRVINNRTIENGTFEGTVENNTNGTISGGTFAGSVSNNGGTVNGGIFNGNTGLDEVTDLHSITVASGAKIEKVNGVPAEWAPYVVTSNATTKTNY